MDLVEAGLDIGAHHDARLAHRLRRRSSFPWVRAEMIAAKNDPVGGDARLKREALDKGPETRRRHAGVAAMLVDLIAGRLDEDRIVAVAMLAQNRQECAPMGGAPGGQATGAPGAIVRDDRAKLRAGVHRCASRNASMVARWLAPSIGPTLVTASAPAALARCSAPSKL